MSMVRCSQCGAAFSSHRTSCPTCGAERNKGGARLKKKSGVNMRLTIAIVLAVAIIACLIILATMIFGGGSSDTTPADSTTSPDTTDVVTTPPVTTPDTTTPVDTTTPDTTAPDTTEPDGAAATKIDFTNLYYYPSIEGYEVTFAVGETFTFKVETTPADAAVTWDSSDDSVITVDENGAAVAIGTGDANIVASAGDNVFVECHIIVS